MADKEEKRMSETRFGLLLAFDRNSRDFALGVEVGRMWSALQRDPDEAMNFDAHADNAEMFLRMAEALHRPVVSEDRDDNWILVRFGPTEEPDV